MATCARQVGAESIENLGDKEIEITPEMIDAGVEEFDLIDFESAIEGAEDWVVDIYRAMEAAKAKTAPGKRARRA
jgi:hypothetical protein